MKRQKTISTIIYHVLVAAASVGMLYPLLWMLGSSFKPNNEIFTSVERLIPKTFTLENYVNGWRGFAGLSFAVFSKIRSSSRSSPALARRSLRPSWRSVWRGCAFRGARCGSSR